MVRINDKNGMINRSGKFTKQRAKYKGKLHEDRGGGGGGIIKSK